MSTEMTPPWPDEFETLVRQHLPLLGREALASETSLVDMGLDSLGTVGLLITLEQRFDVMIPDVRLDADNFATAGRLWSMMHEVIEHERATG